MAKTPPHLPPMKLPPKAKPGASSWLCSRSIITVLLLSRVRLLVSLYSPSLETRPCHLRPIRRDDSISAGEEPSDCFKLLN